MSEEKTEGQKLTEKLGFKIKSAWETASPADLDDIEKFSTRYKDFLNAGKTEREITLQIDSILSKLGFIDAKIAFSKETPLLPGDKIYQNIRGKALNFAIIGKKPVTEGAAILGAHLDSPRIDIKTNPLYEDSDAAFFDTHYYGGIKKYQWTTVPLALHGVIFDSSGNKQNICIGEDENDPVFVITDLLPHLSQEQAEKKMSKAITGEDLDILVGSRPFYDEKAEAKVKLNILRILNKKYGVTESCFASAEIEAVPAQKARDVGFDRSMIGAYGHDDKCCAFASLEAALHFANRGSAPERTVICSFTDKEETGSSGNTSAESRSFEDFITGITAKTSGSYDSFKTHLALNNSFMISSDVNAAFDPAFASVFDKKTCSYCGKGIAISKYTGHGGKYGCSDASAEYVQKIIKIFNAEKVRWQYGNMGKVDIGGGGTIASQFARLGIEVIDCGVPVLSMHSPFEVISKIDLWTAYKGYLAFLKHI
ncbi:MAG: aminopeptidase [Spirochaetaceae bacterium]|jgi:aspartyl aminopeptidase|nr:aminopeptidase [Spirochaetaceae bacterium]